MTLSPTLARPTWACRAARSTGTRRLKSELRVKLLKPAFLTAAAAKNESKFGLIARADVCAKAHLLLKQYRCAPPHPQPPTRLWPGSHLAVRPNLRGICTANCFNLQLWFFPACDQIFSSGRGVTRRGLECKVKWRPVDFSHFHMWPPVWKWKGNKYKLP